MMRFEEPVIEINKFMMVDVITTSGEEPLPDPDGTQFG